MNTKVVVKGIANEEKNLLVFKNKNEYEDKVKVYTVGKYGYITKEKFELWKNTIYDNRTPCIMIQNKTKISLKEFYNKIIKDADELKEKTNGIINMYKTGRYTKTALTYYFNKCFNKLNIQVENISFKEAKWIDKASCGGLLLSKKYKGPAYSYDFVSCYPSIMRDNKMLFPIKHGEFKILSTVEFNELKFYQYGIYNVEIFKSDKANINKAFKYNIHNKYTHIDLTLAKNLGLKMKVQNNEKSNFLYYSREKLISGKVLFKEYIDYFFNLKQQNISGVKKLLHCLWGSLVEKNVKKIKYDFKNGIILKDDNEIIENIPLQGTKMIAFVVNPNAYFEYNLARIKPFLLAKARKKLSEVMQPYINKIVYAHTDGFIIKEKINIKTGNNIGELKYEGYNEKFYCNNITDKSPKESFKLN